MRVLVSVPSASSSSEKLGRRQAATRREGEVLGVVRHSVLDDHDLPPLVVREGAGHLLARADEMFVTGLPSLQMAEA